MYVTGDIFVLNDDQQPAVSIFLVQEVHRILLPVTLLQQVLLQHKSTQLKYLLQITDFEQVDVSLKLNLTIRKILIG